ncbi:MAG TPA: M48 family metalloprotease [Burkholderiales bacterium]|nr:M48 family metalloprotease [Burkholderiales bacterium]
MKHRMRLPGRVVMHWLITVLPAMLLLAPAGARAQGVLDLRADFDFASGVVEAAAERGYDARLRALAAASRLDGDTRLLERARRLVGQLARAVQVEVPQAAGIEWQVHTCGGCGENAAAVAGGKLMLGQEFMASLAPSDDELAFLLAHEMAHVLAEHTREFASAARYFADNGRNRRYEDVQRELDESFVLNRRMAALYAQQELEADYIGLILGARAGFDPAAMPSLLARLPGGDSLLALHPGGNTRLEQARATLQTAYRVREQGLRGAARP